MWKEAEVTLFQTGLLSAYFYEGASKPKTLGLSCPGGDSNVSLTEK
jgi:hypothetical protein